MFLLQAGYAEIVAWEYIRSMRRIEMAEVHLNGLVFVFYDDDALMEWLDANADEVREDK